MKEQLVQKALVLGFDDCRVTTAQPPESAEAFQRWLGQGRHGTMAYLERNSYKRIDPNQVLAGARSIITLAASYYAPDSLPAAPNRGIIARYARYSDYHDVLARRLEELSAHVNSLGPVGTKSLWYVDTGPILERAVAQRSGLGFAGKHTNLISRRLGNWFFISEILTTLEIEPDAPEPNRCGSCSRCLSACPTQAITAPFELDARRCISYLTIELKGPIPAELRQSIGNRIYGCDICLEVCPWNRFAQTGRLMQPHARDDLQEADLIELLSMDDMSFKARFAGTPMLRTKRRGVLRNVCVALGNVGTPAALTALEKASRDPEPLIAEHALWAIDEIRRRQTGDPAKVAAG